MSEDPGKINLNVDGTLKETDHSLAE